MNSKKAITIGLAFLLCFYGFSRLVKQDRLNSIDFDVTVKIQDRVSQSMGLRIDSPMEDIGFFASPAFSVVALGGITVLAFFRQKTMKGKMAAIIIPIAFVLLIAAEVYGKSVVHHPAPPFFMLKNPTTMFPTYHVWEEFSYPSGHAARAMFFAIVSFFLLPKKKRMWGGVLLGGYVVLIAFSRIYLGHHWFSDIVGGLIVGAGFSLLAIGAYNINYIEIE